MSEPQFSCEHVCKNTCSTLHEVLTRENEILQHYKDVVEECSMLNIKSFIEERISEKRKVIYNLLQVLNEMKVNSAVIDDIAESYETIDN